MFDICVSQNVPLTTSQKSTKLQGRFQFLVAEEGRRGSTRAESMNQFYDLRHKSTIMVPQITQTLLKKLALSLDWGPNLSA